MLEQLLLCPGGYFIIIPGSLTLPNTWPRWQWFSSEARHRYLGNPLVVEITLL